MTRERKGLNTQKLDRERREINLYRQEMKAKRRAGRRTRNVLVILGVLTGTTLLYSFSPPGSNTRAVIEKIVNLLLAVIFE